MSKALPCFGAGSHGINTIGGGVIGMLVFLQRWAYDHDIRFKLFNPSRFVRRNWNTQARWPPSKLRASMKWMALLGQADAAIHSLRENEILADHSHRKRAGGHSVRPPLKLNFRWKVRFEGSQFRCRHISTTDNKRVQVKGGDKSVRPTRIKASASLPDGARPLDFRPLHFNRWVMRT